MKRILLFLAVLVCVNGIAQNPVKKDSSDLDAFVIHLDDKYPDVRIMIDRPQKMRKGYPTRIVFYALPNGNTIEWTAGKKLYSGDDWHYDIQHIAAQTRFLREKDKSCNYVTVYLMASGKSWGGWRTLHKDDKGKILPAIVDEVTAMFSSYHPSVILSSHSGGGYFIFEYIRALPQIPNKVERIVFLDSTYGYEDSLHIDKLSKWLGASKKHRLLVTSYDDTTVRIDGKPIVSLSGGTWGRSFAMAEALGKRVKLNREETGEFVCFRSPGKGVSFKLKKNQEGKIYHTVLVERNGFIDTVLEGTPNEGRGYEFWGERAYEKFISTESIR